ncbi:MAG: ATP-binding cassette domain-containing protein [Bdellovibrio sp.]|nr:ATP-binding cassette domain-containing protein [Bdellovibrio sp.]
MNVQNLSFSYVEKPLFQNLNFEFKSATITLIQGPSGCGKSTFLKLVAGLLDLQSGQIVISPNSKIGYLHQDCHLIDHWSIQENLSLVSTDLVKQKNFLREFDLQMPGATPASQLSGGERQRVSIVRTLLQNPEIVLLDEPTAHLDDEQTAVAMKLIKTHLGTKTILIVSHDKRLFDYADQKLDWKLQVSR